MGERINLGKLREDLPGTPTTMKQLGQSTVAFDSCQELTILFKSHCGHRKWVLRTMGPLGLEPEVAVLTFH